MPRPVPPALDDTVLVLQLRAQWDVAFTGRGESSWSFILDRTVDPVGQAEGLAALWIANIKPFWVARRPPEWRFTRILVEDRWPHTTVGLEIDVDEYGEAGDFNGAPVQISPIHTLYSAYSGRSYRGRTFWGQIRVEDLEGSSINEPLWVLMNNWANAMYFTFCAPSLFPSDPKLAVVSRTHDGAPAVPPRYALVTDVTPKRYLAIQRRRNRHYQS
jgi:hypothetical protein